jgi:hypothetical protein
LLAERAGVSVHAIVNAGAMMAAGQREEMRLRFMRSESKCRSVSSPTRGSRAPRRRAARAPRRAARRVSRASPASSDGPAPRPDDPPDGNAAQPTRSAS